MLYLYGPANNLINAASNRLRLPKCCSVNMSDGIQKRNVTDESIFYIFFLL
jgi:hypothetical protein